MLNFLPLLLVGGLVGSSQAAASCPKLCKGGKPASSAAALAGYAPASAYCSSKFPIPRQTCTTSKGKATVTRTSTRTVTTTVGDGATATADPVTVTSTETSASSTVTVIVATTETDTVVFNIGQATVTQNHNKRYIPVPTYPGQGGHADPRATKLAALKREAKALQASACSCLEDPKTTTKTVAGATSTKRVTKTSTTTETADPNGTFTPTSTVTTTVTSAAATITSTTTTEVTITRTAAQATQTVLVGNDNACTPPTDPSTLAPGTCGPAGTNCACYGEANGNSGYCADFYGTCDAVCQTNMDCPVGTACLAAAFTGNCGTNVCASTNDDAQCSTGVAQKKRSINPMAFKLISRGSKAMRSGLYVAPANSS